MENRIKLLIHSAFQHLLMERMEEKETFKKHLAENFLKL